MSFLEFHTHKTNIHEKTCLTDRKENLDSLTAIKNDPLNQHEKERASAFISRGSITLEAAVVVPIFFFAMLCLAYLLELMAIQTTIRNALYSTGKTLAQETYVSSLVTTQEIEAEVVNNIGREWLDKSIVEDGSAGIQCGNSICDMITGVMNLSAKYRVKIPIAMFGIAPISYEETLRVKMWNGSGSELYEHANEQLVYVTETGMVYHADQHCTYLDMSVHSVRREEVEEQRNESGAKYHACENCASNQNNSDIYYITDYGTRYHVSLDCKKIKRNIYAIPVEEAYGMGGCSKCVK